jgi:minor histocompatibility antigen H13
LVIKYFGKEWINWLLGWYFSIAGVGSVWKSAVTITRYLIGAERWKQFEPFSVEIKKGSSSLFSSKWRTPSVLLLPLSVIPSALYRYSSASRRSALLTDVLSMSFSHNALSLLKLDSFKTGTALLSGLFLYDIWWVFGTPVMVSVATSLDVPIKLLWPKSVLFSDMNGFTMLGLGDIVIPGAFVALALRYDYYRHLKAGKSGSSFNRPYFNASLVAYIAGLVTTMSVMHMFKAAQPALLYLSPACILSFVITAFLRGELTEAWNWIDESETGSKEESKKQD